MKGLEINRAYFEEYGKKMLEEFEDIKNLLAIGSVGSGSENFGFDDEISRDHDFEPSFCVFVPDDIDERRLFLLERAYSKLPNEFMGLKRQKMSPVGGNRHGVIKTSDFYSAKCGSKNGELSVNDWLTLPDFYLAEATNGEIFFDGLGEFSAIREKLLNMPNDVFLKKLAGNLLLMKQSGQYNYERILSHGERAGAQLAVIEFCKAAINVVFLLNKRYKPFYKWIFRAFSALPKFSHLSAEIEFLLTSDNDRNTAAVKHGVIEDICGEIADYLIENKMTKATCHDLEKHAYSVNDSIADAEIRNANVLSAV